MINLNDAYTWLHAQENFQVSEPAQELVNKLHEHLQASGHQPQIEFTNLQKELNRIRFRLPGPMDVAELCLEFGRTAYMIGNYSEADHFLDEAAQKYRPNYLRMGTAKWMRGCALMEMGGKWSARAIKVFEESVNAFIRLTRETGNVSGQKSIYLLRIREMEQSIQDYSSLVETAQAISTIPTNLVISNPEPIPEESNSSLQQSFLQIFTIRDEIPAGDPIAVGYDRYQTSQLEIEQVKIEGRSYHIHNLRSSSRLINLSPFFLQRKPLVTLQVKGDSMNLAGIEEGDYVLVSLQRDAAPGDIVVAQIAGVDTEATLKRFWRSQDGSIRLEPQSSNERHQPIDIPARSGGFEIRGIAIAVFKPI